MRREVMRLFAIHVAGNAVVLGVAYYWLGIGESHAATLAWSAALALIILCLACCLHGGTLVFFRAGESRSLSVAFRTDRKSTRLNSSHLGISYAVFCLKKK